MHLNDYIGKRGENLFRVMITEFCDGSPLFDETFLGEKHPTTDFMVELLGRSPAASFFVQVKATRSNYRGRGAARKLVVGIKATEIRNLIALPFPTYIVGVDIDLGIGYLVNPRQLPLRRLTGLATSNPLNCGSLRALWLEVDEWYRSRLEKSQNLDRGEEMNQ